MILKVRLSQNEFMKSSFDIENWLWKSEIGIFWSLDLERMLIWQNYFLWKSAIFHSIKLPFDAEVDEKFLNVIYIDIYLLDRSHDVVVVVVIVLLSEKYDIQW